MKEKQLLVTLVISGTICGIIGYTYLRSLQKEEPTLTGLGSGFGELITFEEACSVFSQRYLGGGRWEDFVELYGEDREYSFKVCRKDNIAGYFLYRASNGTLFEADYQSGEVGKALLRIIVPEDKEEYYVWEIVDLSPEYGANKDKYIDARNGEILLGLPRGKRGPSPTPVPTPPPPEESPTPTEETPLPPPTKPPLAYSLNISFPSMPVTVIRGESVTLPVAIKSFVDDEPIRIRLALVSSPDQEVPLPEFITYEVEGYITVNPHETVHTQVTIKVSEDAQLGKWGFCIHGELEKPLEGYSGEAICFSLVVEA